MSRSRKKNNAGGVTTAKSEKEDKRIWHKRMRTRTKQAIHNGDEMPHENEVSNPWNMSKDGKTFYSDDKLRRK